MLRKLFPQSASGWLKRVEAAMGVNNLFDRMPPPAPHAFPVTNADVTHYSPIGRLTFVRARVKL
ncbi:MAG: hypothetical protein HY736_14255 [Verrucomicrobia bacterium]|nr:hypothetical protein [Verrucomicrobiota bacterium]